MHEGLTEDVLRVDGYDLAPRNGIGKQLVEVIGLDCFGVIAHVGGSQRVFIGKLPINSDGEIVFIRYLLAGEGKNPGITIAQERTIRQRVKRINEAKYIGIDGDASGGKVSSARGWRGDSVYRGHTEGLAKTFVVSKDEHA